MLRKLKIQKNIIKLSSTLTLLYCFTGQKTMLIKASNSLALTQGIAETTDFTAEEPTLLMTPPSVIIIQVQTQMG